VGSDALCELCVRNPVPTVVTSVCYPSLLLTNTTMATTTDLSIDGAFLIEEVAYKDNRGYFQELYREKKIPNKYPVDATKWRQVAISISEANVIRGLHCSPYPKLCTVTSGTFCLLLLLPPQNGVIVVLPFVPCCVSSMSPSNSLIVFLLSHTPSGRIYEVIVDLRPKSPSFLKWTGVWYVLRMYYYHDYACVLRLPCCLRVLVSFSFFRLFLLIRAMGGIYDDVLV